MKMKKDLVNGVTFKIEESKRLGNVRIDWYDGKLCNQWNPTNLLIELKSSSKIDLGKLQQELNYLQFELLSSFRRVENYCNGTGYDKERIFTISLEYFNYAIKLKPVKDDYSYIYAYLK